jgi:hypothetical protein
MGGRSGWARGAVAHPEIWKKKLGTPIWPNFDEERVIVRGREQPNPSVEGRDVSPGSAASALRSPAVRWRLLLAPSAPNFPASPAWPSPGSALRSSAPNSPAAAALRLLRLPLASFALDLAGYCVRLTTARQRRPAAAQHSSSHENTILVKECMYWVPIYSIHMD